MCAKAKRATTIFGEDTADLANHFTLLFLTELKRAIPSPFDGVRVAAIVTERFLAAMTWAAVTSGHHRESIYKLFDETRDAARKALTEE